VEGIIQVVQLLRKALSSIPSTTKKRERNRTWLVILGLPLCGTYWIHFNKLLLSPHCLPCILLIVNNVI
jgi:hypothetical protein